jgi:chloride channel protein, CIC family
LTRSVWQRPRVSFNLTGETRLLVTVSLIVGVGAGLGAYGFRWLISFVQHLAWDQGGVLIAWMPLRTVMIPALGGALVGPLVYFLAREAKGHGVPEVMLAIAREEGRIRFRVVFVKALASALCIGTGGSAGREGPIVQIGSALGAAVGQLMRLPVDLRRTLLAAGAAGGISATFNAPIAGVVFSLEVILREFSARSFSVVVLASVTATVISRALLGNYPAFFVPPYELRSAWELLFYAFLGILAALVAQAFIWALYRCEDAFDAWRVPEYLKPIAGGLSVGILGLALPQVFGVGYETVEEALRGNLPLTLLPVLIMAKLVATSLTLGSGGSGGVFSPSLFMGAMLGGSVGHFFHRLFPSITAPPGAYALVAMGAVFGGAAHAPITSILILFEMTGDYRIILPLMTSVVISTLVSHFMSPETIYSIKLRRRGIDVLAPPRPNPLGNIRVAEVMVRQVVTVPDTLTLRALIEHFRRHRFASFPVIDSQNRLVGILGYEELREALGAERPDDALTARDLMRTPPPVAFPDDTLTEVADKFRAAGAGRLPVVSRDNPSQLLGIVSHRDVLGAYQRVVLGSSGE